MVALDPTPAQERLLLSHAGAARFAYNAGLAHVRAAIEAKEKPEWSLYGLRRWWNANKDTLAVNADGTPWWRENSKEAYSSGLESLANALSSPGFCVEFFRPLSFVLLCVCFLLVAV